MLQPRHAEPPMPVTSPDPGEATGGLASLREAWTDLHRQAPRATTFNGLDHVALWCRLFAPDGEARVRPVVDAGRTLGFLPLVAERRKGIRILRSLTNAHCCHEGSLVGEAPGAAFAAAALAALRQERGWDVLLLEHHYSFEGPDPLPDEALAACGLPWERVEVPTFVITLGKPFEDYFRQDLSKKRRHYFQNYANRVERSGGAGYEHLRDAAAAAAWDEFVAIEDSGWKGTEGTSLLRESQAVRDYYRGLVDLLAAQGRLRLSFMSIGGRRVAGGFGHLQGDTLHLTKMGYRDDAGPFAPSSLLLLQMIRDAAAAFGEAARIHLYPWDHGYKHRFVNGPASAVTTWVFNDTLRGRAARLWRAQKAQASPPPAPAPGEADGA